MRASCELVTESFGQEMGNAFEKRYTWQFLENPAGSGIILMAYDGNKLVGQLCSIPCNYVLMNKYYVTATAGEWLCVSPHYRGKGLMLQLLNRRAKLENPFPFVLDSPNKNSLNGFVKYQCHTLSVKQLIRPVKLSQCFAYKKIPRQIISPFDKIWKKKDRAETDGSSIEEYTSAFDNEFNELFETTNENIVIRQVRNAEFLNWRYRKAPGRTYKTIISKGKEGKILGYIIISLSKIHGISIGLIMDFWTKNEKSGKDLIRYALRYLWNNGVALASAISSPNCLEYRSLKSEGFYNWPRIVCPNPVKLFIKPRDENKVQIDPHVLLNSNNWFIMFGDFYFN
jgi:hypothetical protein